ncbi:MAG: hypothetical protein OEU92_17915 [Alphaproteobacteria bacterium]|nr:hypothetical protein [Alphaproteobacteria bacterium]
MAKSVTRWWALVVAMILGFVSRGGLAQDSADTELRAFEKARAENTQAAYRNFLRRYPEGQYTADAFRDLVGAVVKSERPIFEPAFDHQLLVEGLMPAPLDSTLTAAPSNAPTVVPSDVPRAASLDAPTAPSPNAPGAAGTARRKGSVASRLLDPY